MTLAEQTNRVILPGLWIPGRARPKGSLKPQGNRYGGKVVLVDDSVEATNWLRTVRNAVQVAISEPCDRGDQGAKWLSSVNQWRRLAPGYAPCAVAVAVELIVLCLPMPSELEDAEPFPTHITHGDTDKLQRAVGDGLEQGGLIKNDKQITTWDARKRFIGWRGAHWYPAIPRDMAGAFVRVREDDDA
jgi:hypothetical protein